MYKIGISDFNDAIFEKIILILFGAEYSADTDKIREIIKKLETNFSVEKVEFYEIDVDEYPQICEKFDIHTIPCVGVFKQAKAKIRIDGVKDQVVYIDAINDCLK